MLWQARRGLVSGRAAIDASAAPSGSIYGAHRYWMTAIPSYNGASNVLIPEQELRDASGGANLLGAGTATASTYWSGDSTTYAASKIYDGNTATYWRSSPVSVDNGEYWRYDAGSGNTLSVFEVALTGPISGEPNSAPKSAFFAFSDDNAAWQAAFGVTAQTSWSALEQRVFTDPQLDANAAHRYWSIVTFDDGGTGSMFLSTLEMHATAGGADQCSGGTPLGDGWSNLSNLFDGSGSTYANKNGVITWAGYDFGSTKTVVEIVLKIGDGFTLPAPRHLSVMCSDDGLIWTSAWSIATGSWGSGESKTFTKP